MNISGLPVDLEEFVQRALAEGKRRSEAELLADALRILREHHRDPESHRENGAPHAPSGRFFKKPSKTSRNTRSSIFPLRLLSSTPTTSTAHLKNPHEAMLCQDLLPGSALQFDSTVVSDLRYNTLRRFHHEEERRSDL
jgi:Arc/MetJ-type ribon-helix-helix transcriptional regulator